MKVSKQTDAQAWKAQADAGQAAMLCLSALLHDQLALPALSFLHQAQAAATMLLAPTHVSGWCLTPLQAQLWAQMLPHASFLVP